MADIALENVDRELVGFVVRLSGESGLGEKDRTYLSGTYRSIWNSPPMPSVSPTT